MLLEARQQDLLATSMKPRAGVSWLEVHFKRHCTAEQKTSLAIVVVVVVVLLLFFKNVAAHWV